MAGELENPIELKMINKAIETILKKRREADFPSWGGYWLIGDDVYAAILKETFGECQYILSLPTGREVGTLSGRAIHRGGLADQLDFVAHCPFCGRPVIWTYQLICGACGGTLPGYEQERN